MAEKLYSKGDIVGMFGKTLSKSISVAGAGVFIGSKFFATGVRGLFWFTSKQIDLTHSLTKAKYKVYKKPNKTRRPSVDMVTSPAKPAIAQSINIATELKLVKQALDYSQRAYELSILPMAEIDSIDGQAIAITTALQNHLNKEDNIKFKEDRLHLVDNMLQAAHFYRKYHQTGKEKHLSKAKELLIN
ncbi:MAG: hypothetical protein HQK83_04440 [Fibrobacteria bacterium]|nr:hypothetical protein [Fibrobacteria bacterium]